jgi:hypothetical protein
MTHQALEQTQEHNVVSLHDISGCSDSLEETTLVCPSHDGNDFVKFDTCGRKLFEVLLTVPFFFHQ